MYTQYIVGHNIVQTSADITGIDESLVIRFHIIIRCLSSGNFIVLPLSNLEIILWETAEMRTDLHNWYYMSPVVHKMLCRGFSTAKTFMIQTRQLSEEAQGVKMKDINNFEPPCVCASLRARVSVTPHGSALRSDVNKQIACDFVAIRAARPSRDNRIRVRRASKHCTRGPWITSWRHENRKSIENAVWAAKRRRFPGTTR